MVTNRCKNECLKYKAPIQNVNMYADKKRIDNNSHYGMYLMGYKRCRTCDLFLNVSQSVFRCPCCKFILSTRPRNMKYKIIYYSNKPINNINTF